MSFKKIKTSVGAPTTSNLPEGIFEGERAINVQSFKEAQIKLGSVFYIRYAKKYGRLSSSFTPDLLASGDSVFLSFLTGITPVLLYSRIFKYAADELKIRIYTGPTYTNSESILVNNYNLLNPNSATVSVKDITGFITNPGILSENEEVYFGPNGDVVAQIAQRYGNTSTRRLATNTEYCIEIFNSGSSDARFEYFLDWYEGDIDLPLA